MMIFTHMLMGALLGVCVSILFPSYLHIALLAGLIGGAVPDLDMIFTHRRTLHFPILSSVASIAIGGLVFIWPTPISIAMLCFSSATAIHSLTDILGGGKEMRPWLETDDRAVFNHVTKTWIKPRRVFYDGSVADLALGMVLAVILLWTLPPQYTIPIGTILLIGIVYTFFRRWITRRISTEYQTFSQYIQHKLRWGFNKG